MKPKLIFICLITMLTLVLSNQVTADSPRAEISKIVVKGATTVGMLVVTATTAAFGSSELEEWVDKKFDAEKLKQYEGYDGKVAMYSLDVTLDGDAISGLFGLTHPNIYFVIDIQGQDKYILPDIEYSFKGGRILKSFLAKNYKPGSNIQITIYDSDATSNAIFNNLLRTKITAEGGISTNGAVPIKAEAAVSGNIQLIKDGQTLVLDAPEIISSVIGTAPKEKDKFFEAKGKLTNDKGNTIGSIEFKKEWEKKVSKSIFSSVFYLIIAFGLLVGLITYFYKNVIKKQSA